MFIKRLILSLMALLFLDVELGDARGLRGGSLSGGGGTLLTTLTLANTSTSAQPTNFVTDVFGHVFKKGDIPNGCSGAAPQFRLTGGTNVPFSEELAPKCWNDGSLERSSFLMRVPASIPGGWNIISGTYNSGTGVIVLTVSGTPGLTIGVTVNLDNLTGTGAFGTLNSNYAVTASSGSTVTIAGPTGRGASSITGGFLANTLTINILNGGTTPAASSRSLSDFAAGGVDYHVDGNGLTGVTGFGNLSGLWSCNLNQGIGAAHSDDYHFIGGQAGDVYRTRASMRQSGADHGQLECIIEEHTLQDVSGNLYGLRFFPRVTQPWYNRDTPTKNWRGFSGLTVNNGASVIRDVFASNFGTGRNFTVSGNSLNATANGLTQGLLVALTTTGSLPPGLSTSQAYFVNAPSTNAFTIGDNSSGNTVGPGGACTGTCAATPYPFVTHFGSLFPLGTTGKPDYVQGAGSSASDNTVNIIFNMTYWRSTRMVPPYLIGTVTPSNPPQYPFAIQGTGPVTSGTSGTGERDDIGLFNGWSANDFYLQTSNTRQTVRTVGLVGGQLPVNLKNTSTFTGPVVNNTTYSGLPTPNISFRWVGLPGGFVQGFTGPADTNVYIQLLNTASMDHMTEFEYWAFLTLGNLHYYEMAQEWANYAIGTVVGQINQSAIVTGTTNAISGIGNNGGGARDSTINGTHYYAAPFNTGSGLREEAWTLRDMGIGCITASNYGANATSWATYQCDKITSAYGAYNAYTGLLPAPSQAMGLFYEGPAFGALAAVWEVGYHQLVDNLLYGATEIAGALTFSNYESKFATGIDLNVGTYMVTCYYCVVRTGDSDVPVGNAGAHPYIQNYNLFGGGNTTFDTQWDSTGSNVITMTGGPHGYAPRNNDTVVFTTGTGAQPIPSGLSGFVEYFMVNASGNNFQLATTLGGSPLSVASETFSSGSYNSGTGRVTITTTAPHGLIAFNTIVISGATGTGTNVSSLNGTVTTVGTTTGSTITYDIAAGLNITSITGLSIANQSNQSAVNAPGFPSTNNTYSYPGTGASTLQNIVCGLSWNKALGGTADNTAINDLTTNLQSITGYASASNSEPKYTCGPNF